MSKRGAAGWSFALLCYAALLARLGQGVPLVYRFFNADALYFPALYTDLFIDGGQWRDWQLPSAPFYFPDTPVYLLLFRIFGRFEAATLLYGLAQYVLLLFLLSRALGTVLRSERPPESVLYGGGIALLLLASGHFDFFVFALLPGAHMSALVFAVAGFLLLRRTEEPGGRAARAALLTGTTLLCASDRLTFVSFVAPACVYLLLWSRAPRRIARAGALAAAAGLGLALFYAEGALLHDQLPLEVVRRQKPFDLHTLLATLADEPGLVAVIALSVATHGLLVLARRRLDAGAIGFFLTSHAGVLLAAPILADRGDLLVHQRYFLVVWLFGALGFAPLVRVLAGRPAPSLPAWLRPAASIVPLALLAAFATGPRGEAVDGWHFYPRIARCIDAYMARRGAESLTGIGDYWFARLIQLTSRRDVHMLAVEPNVEPSTTLQGRHAVLEAERRGGYDLVVAWDLDPGAANEKLRRPDYLAVCDSIPHPKEGRPELEFVEVWGYDRKGALPWPVPGRRR